MSEEKGLLLEDSASDSFSEQDYSLMNTRSVHRNRIINLWKNHPWFLAYVLLLHAICISFSIELLLPRLKSATHIDATLSSKSRNPTDRSCFLIRSQISITATPIGYPGPTNCTRSTVPKTRRANGQECPMTRTQKPGTTSFNVREPTTLLDSLNRS